MPRQYHAPPCAFIPNGTDLSNPSLPVPPFPTCLPDLAELQLPDNAEIRFPEGKDKTMHFEITLRPKEGIYRWDGPLLLTHCACGRASVSVCVCVHVWVGGWVGGLPRARKGAVPLCAVGCLPLRTLQITTLLHD